MVIQELNAFWTWNIEDWVKGVGSHQVEQRLIAQQNHLTIVENLRTTLFFNVLPVPLCCAFNIRPRLKDFSEIYLETLTSKVYTSSTFIKKKLSIKTVYITKTNNSLQFILGENRLEYRINFSVNMDPGSWSYMNEEGRQSGAGSQRAWQGVQEASGRGKVANSNKASDKA